MSRRKTAQRGPAKKAEPESKVRYLLIDRDTAQPTIGCWNSRCHGLTSFERATRLADSLAIQPAVVPAHIFFGTPNPDDEAT